MLLAFPPSLISINEANRKYRLRILFACLHICWYEIYVWKSPDCVAHASSIGKKQTESFIPHHHPKNRDKACCIWHQTLEGESFISVSMTFHVYRKCSDWLWQQMRIRMDTWTELDGNVEQLVRGQSSYTCAKRQVFWKYVCVRNSSEWKWERFTAFTQSVHVWGIYYWKFFRLYAWNRFTLKHSYTHASNRMLHIEIVKGNHKFFPTFIGK